MSTPPVSSPSSDDLDAGSDGPRRPTRVSAALVVWVLGAAASLTPWVGPGLALAGGAALGLTLGDPLEGRSSSYASRALKIAVVGLGVGLSLDAVVATGRTGVVVTAVGITVTLALGTAIGRALHVEEDTSTLVSGGTAICGGSAIAAMSPTIGARASATSVALATVFVLNGVALYLFPPVGAALDLTQQQFGTWAAIAIHDTSSVVGAAATYGEEALQLATVLKLTRALWIIPLVALLAWRRRHRAAVAADGGADDGGADDRGASGRAPLPWFIALFVAASALRLLVPAGEPLFDLVETAARQVLVLALFLVGAGLTRRTLAAVGMRPLLQGVLLWAAVAGGSLALVLAAPGIVG